MHSTHLNELDEAGMLRGESGAKMLVGNLKISLNEI